MALTPGSLTVGSVSDTAGAMGAIRAFREVANPLYASGVDLRSPSAALTSMGADLRRSGALGAMRTLDDAARGRANLITAAGKSPVAGLLSSSVLDWLKPNPLLSPSLFESLGLVGRHVSALDVTAFSSQRSFAAALTAPELLDSPPRMLRELNSSGAVLGRAQHASFAALTTRGFMPAGPSVAASVQSMLRGVIGSDLTVGIDNLGVGLRAFGDLTAMSRLGPLAAASGLLNVSGALREAAGVDARRLTQLAVGLSTRPPAALAPAAVTSIQSTLRWADAVSEAASANALSVLDRLAEELLSLPDEAGDVEAFEGAAAEEDGLLAAAISAGQELAVAAGARLTSAAEWTWGVPLWWAPALVRVWPELSTADRQHVRYKAAAASAGLMAVAYYATTGQVAECLIAAVGAYAVVGELYRLVEQLDAGL